MYTASGTLAVVAAPVPAADRRGLSQAWYSALHLAEASTTPTRAGAPRLASGGVVGAVAAPPARARGFVPGPSSARGGGRLVGRAATPPAPPGDRRDPLSPLARAMLRAVRQRRGAVASAVVASENGRVQIVVRTDGTRTRIVALCNEADRAAVGRALEAARYVLARTGAVLDVDVRTEG